MRKQADADIRRCGNCGAWVDMRTEHSCEGWSEPESVHARRVPGARGPRPFALSMYTDERGRDVYRLTPDQAQNLVRALNRMLLGVEVMER